MDAKNFDFIYGKKFVVHAGGILKFVLLTFMSKYFMIFFPTTKTTIFYPYFMVHMCQVVLYKLVMTKVEPVRSI